MVKWSLLVGLLAVSGLLGLPSDAQVLKGTVQENQELAPIVAPVDKPKENCVCLNPNKVVAVEKDGRWQLVDDGNTILSVGSKEAVDAAIAMIKFYRATDVCALGKADKTFDANSIYFKIGDLAPQKALSEKEDAIRFDNESIKAEQRNGSWKLTAAGDVWLLDFGADEEAARNAAEIIHYYGFTNQCFVGAPVRELMYWHK